MQTFKQYFLGESSWNPQQSLTTTGRGQLSRRMLRTHGKDRDSIQSSIDNADQMLRDPTTDPDTIEQKMIQLGKEFDSLANTRAEDLKHDILTKVRELRQVLKQKQVAGNHHECITLYNNICDLLFEG